MGTVVSIGGGDMKSRETEPADRLVVERTGKQNPNLLFLSTASRDSKGYIKTAREYFTSLGCSVTLLRLCTGNPPDAEIEKRILAADIVYVGGGETAYMMRRWEERGVGDILLRAGLRGTLLAGVSAGAICWAAGGHSESPGGEFVRVDGLGVIPAVLCPHYNHPGRESFDERMKTEPLPGIALEDGAALVYTGETCLIRKTSDSARAFLFSRAGGTAVKKELPAGLPFSL